MGMINANKNSIDKLFIDSKHKDESLNGNFNNFDD